MTKTGVNHTCQYHHIKGHNLWTVFICDKGNQWTDLKQPHALPYTVTASGAGCAGAGQEVRHKMVHHLQLWLGPLSPCSIAMWPGARFGRILTLATCYLTIKASQPTWVQSRGTPSCPPPACVGRPGLCTPGPPCPCLHSLRSCATVVHFPTPGTPGTGTGIGQAYVFQGPGLPCSI